MAIDANKDGKLSYEEIKTVIESKLTLEQCESVMKVL